MSDDEDEKSGWSKAVIMICKVLLVVLPAIGIGGYAASNHAQTSKGYELLAEMVNQHEQRLDTIERTLDRIELQTKKVAPATQVSLTGPIIIPGGRTDLWPHHVTKAPSKAPVVNKTTVLVNPKYVAPPASAPAPKRAPQRRAPSQLREVP